MQSMTGFAEAAGGDGRFSWRWEARGVNGRGLDLRLRLPEGTEALEPMLRAKAQSLFRRGTVTLALRLSRQGGAAVPRLDETALAAALAAIGRARRLAEAEGIALAPPAPERLLALPGVYSTAETEELLTDDRRSALLADAATAMERFAAARAEEGAAIRAILDGQLAEIARLTAAARETAGARAARTGALMRERVAALLGAGAPVEEERLAQELALIAVRADVTEELDRLTAHVDAARGMLVSTDPVGRRLDFLAQEFNREANTLCSKSSAADLTAQGLALKAAIDQLREQVQNVE